MKILRSRKHRKSVRARRSRRPPGLEPLENRLLLAADLFEPNDQFEMAADLGTGDQIHRDLTIDKPNNDDWYLWTASAAGRLKVDVLFLHYQGDLDVRLYDEAQVLLAASETVSDNEHLDLQVVADQSYFIQIQGFFGATQPDYSLAIDGPEPPADSFEPNDRFDTASILQTGDRTLKALSVHQVGDEDWFAWPSPTDGILTVGARFNDRLGDLDLELFDANKQLIVDGTSTTDNEQVSAVVQAGHTYYVRVFGADGDIHRAYDLVIDGPDILPDVFEPNDTFGERFNLGTEDQTHSGLTIHASDEDWFEWSSPADGTLTVDLRFRHALGDLNLALYDAQQNLLADSRSATDDEQVSVPVEADETYVIRVFGSASVVHPGYEMAIDGPEPPIFADAFEPNDSFAAASDLQGMDQVRRLLTLHVPGDEDWYKWTALEGGTLTVDATFSHDLGDVNIELYDATQSLLASSTSTTDNEQITATVAAGRNYFIRAFGAGGEVQRRYDLTIDGPQILPDAYEPNDSFESPADLGTREQTIQGLTIHEANNADWYRWSPARKGTLTVEVRFRNELGDIELELYDEAGNLVDTSTTSGNVETVSWHVDNGESYIIHVFGFGSLVQPDYTLVLDGPGPDADAFEPNDTQAMAFDLGSGNQTHKGLTIHDSQNDDWFTIDVPVNGTLAADVLFNHSLGDINLELYDAAGQLLAGSHTATDNESVSVPVDAGHTYSIRVYGVGDAVQPSYSLVVRSPGPSRDRFEPNNSLETATELGVGDQIHTGLTIHGPENDDWYRWTAEADGALTVSAEFTHNEGDLNLQLYDGMGGLLASSTTTTDNELISISARAGQTYYVRAYGEEGALQGNYALSVQANDPPTISELTDQTTEEDHKPPTIAFTIGDDETSPQLLTVQGTSSNDSLLPDANLLFGGSGAARTLTIAPIPNQSGQTTITVTVRDPDGGVSTESFELTLTATADMPGLTVTDTEGEEDEAIALNLDAALSDTDGSETLTVEISGVPDGARLSRGTNRGGGTWMLSASDLAGLTLTPAPHDDRDIELTVTAVAVESSNADTARATERMMVTIHAVADAPLVTAADVVGPEDTAIPLRIDATLTDLDGSERLSIEIDGIPSGGGLSAGTDNQDGSWTLAAGDLAQLRFVPPPDEVGEFMLTVRATATEISNGDTATTVLPTSVLVTGVNDPPTISEIADRSTKEDTTTAAIPFSVRDTETEANTLMVSVTSNNQALVRNSNIVVEGTGVERSLRVIPVAQQHGSATITVRVSDGDKLASESFVLTVEAVDDAPRVVAPMGRIEVVEDAPDSTFDLARVFADADSATDGDRLTYSIASNSNSNLVRASVAADRLTLAYDAERSGAATIVVRATDQSGLSVDDTVSVTVASINDAPVHNVPDPQTVQEDTTLTFATEHENVISIRDVDAGTADVSVVIAVNDGRLALNTNQGITVAGNGTSTLNLRGSVDSINLALDGLTYTPNANFFGADSLSIRTDDRGNTGAGGAKVDSDSVDILVEGVNDPPVITSSASAAVIENTTSVLTVTATDVDGDDLRFSLDDGADRSAFTIDPVTGVLRFVSGPDFEAPADASGDNVYEVEVIVRDGQGAVISQTITVTVMDLDESVPTVQIAEVRPDPRIGAVDAISIVFSEAVTGFDVGDLTFTRSTDDIVRLSSNAATLSTVDNTTWTLGNLADLTDASGIYELRLVAAESGIVDAGGNVLVSGAAERWVTGAGDANEDGRFDQSDIIAVLQAAKYLTGEPAKWSEGDWNGDGLFNQRDVIISQQTFPPHYMNRPSEARVDPAVRGIDLGQPTVNGPSKTLGHPSLSPPEVDAVLAEDGPEF